MSGLPGASSPGAADRLLGAVSADPESPAEGRQHRDDELRVLALAARQAIDALERRLADPT